MATGQTLLDLMEVLDNENQLQAGEEDVVRGLIALNAAQDYFESLCALRPDILGDTTGTVSTAAATETTSFPSGLLRVDRLQFIDATTSRPSYDLIPIHRTGGSKAGASWYDLLTSSSGGRGKPVGYWTDGRNIYWDPLPDATHTIRWYGFSAAAAITASGTFLYPDICQLPFASFACRLLSVGVGDATEDLTSLAASTFGPTLQALGNFRREGAPPFEYSQIHTT